MLENSLFLIYSIIPSSQISGLRLPGWTGPQISAARNPGWKIRGYCKSINSILFVNCSGVLFHIPILQASIDLANA